MGRAFVLNALYLGMLVFVSKIHVYFSVWYDTPACTMHTVCMDRGCVCVGGGVCIVPIARLRSCRFCLQVLKSSTVSDICRQWNSNRRSTFCANAFTLLLCNITIELFKCIAYTMFPLWHFFRFLLLLGLYHSSLSLAFWVTHLVICKIRGGVETGPQKCARITKPMQETESPVAPILLVCTAPQQYKKKTLLNLHGHSFALWKRIYLCMFWTGCGYRCLNLLCSVMKRLFNLHSAQKKWQSSLYCAMWHRITLETVHVLVWRTCGMQSKGCHVHTLSCDVRFVSVGYMKLI